MVQLPINQVMRMEPQLWQMPGRRFSTPVDRSAGVLPSFRGMMFSVRRPGGYAMSKSDLIALAVGAIVATVTYCWSRWVRLRASQRYWDAWRKNLPADSDEMIEKKGHFRTESDSPESKSTERAA